MANAQDFESFYTRNIQPYAKELDGNRMAYKNWKMFTFATGLFCVLSFVLFHLKLFPSGGLLAVAFLVMCIAGIYFCTLYKERYTEDFKEKIIRQIIAYINPGASYKPLGFVSKTEYKASGLFRRIFTHFDGNDYWESNYNGMSFHCSEIESAYRDATGGTTIFKGLFITVQLLFNFSSGTYIWVKNNIQLPASLADERYRMYAMPGIKMFKTGNTAFDNAYSVYCTSSYEAGHMLKDGMTARMLLLKERLNKDIVFSFVAGRCYVAIPFEEDLLEPVEKGVNDKEAIRNYFYTILLVFNVIKTLELKRLT